MKIHKQLFNGNCNQKFASTKMPQNQNILFNILKKSHYFISLKIYIHIKLKRKLNVDLDSKLKWTFVKILSI